MCGIESNVTHDRENSGSPSYISVLHTDANCTNTHKKSNTTFSYNSTHTDTHGLHSTHTA